MAWIDGTYLQAAVGSSQGYALGLLTTSTGTTTTDRFTQYELLARGRVIAAMQFAGYPAPSATLPTYTVGDPGEVTNAFLQDMTCGILLSTVYNLVPGIEISDATQSAINAGPRMVAALRDGKLPVPGLTATAIDGYGGSQFNTAANAYPPIVTSPIFRKLRGTGF